MTASSQATQEVFIHPDESFSGKLIVAVHGMGDQTRNDFAQTMTRLFARYFAKKDRIEYQATLLPLGAWDSGDETPVDDKVVRLVSHGDAAGGLADYAFGEVYWADIPRTMETERYRIEEPTHWARNLVQRVAQRYGGDGGLGPKSMHLAGFVVEEIGETIGLLRLVARLGKLGSFKQEDLDGILLRYLCDVQQIGDFVRQREKARLRFFHRLARLHGMYPRAEIHLVAHSEGAAVALFSLLSALNPVTKKAVEDRMQEIIEAARRRGDTKERKMGMDWIKSVRSFSTLGAPIDKHLLLFPEMWTDFGADTDWIKLPEPGIRWRNYYDYADPVGYELDTARERLEEWKCHAFEYPQDDEQGDHGFRRYAIPGQAHLAYFTDDGLFAHIIQNAVLGEAATAPQSNWKKYLSCTIPFLLVALLLLAAVFIFHRSLVGNDPEVSYPRAFQILGETPDNVNADAQSTLGILGCTALLIGTTVLARILRLTRTIGMFALAFAIYAAGVFTFCKIPGYFTLEAAHRAGVGRLTGTEPAPKDDSKPVITAVPLPKAMSVPGPEIGSTANPASASSPKRKTTDVERRCIAYFVVLSFIAVLIAWGADYYACLRSWRPIWGLRILVLAFGLLLFLVLIAPRLGDDSGKAVAKILAVGEHGESVLIPAPGGQKPSAAILIGGWGGFMALWWIGMLIFDLAFCWQRYINVGRSWLSRLRDISRKGVSPVPVRGKA